MWVLEVATVTPEGIVWEVWGEYDTPREADGPMAAARAKGRRVRLERRATKRADIHG